MANQQQPDAKYNDPTKDNNNLKIPLWLSSPVRELIVENGAVCGVIVTREGMVPGISASHNFNAGYA